MNQKELLQQLGKLGFPLMETSDEPDATEVLAEVVKSNDLRLWEGFPVLLANVVEKHRFNYDKVLQKLTPKERTQFKQLVLLSFALYKNQKLRFSWAQQLQKSFSKNDEDTFKKVANWLVHDQEMDLAGKHFDTFRLKATFQNYFEQNAEDTQQQRKKHEELSLEYSLSQLFSAKQKELFQKKLKGLPLTKTEKEYYSRTVKKKVAALANPDLHRLAQKLMDY